LARRWLVPLSAALVLAAGIAVYFMPRAGPGAEAPQDPEARVRAACSGCHLFPPAEILPRSAWRKQIEHMEWLVDYLPKEGGARFSVDEAVEWYETRAPERLPVEPRLTREEPAPLRFRQRYALLEPGGGPGIATVTRLEGFPVPGLDPALASAHMMNGSIHLFSLQRGPRRVGEVGHAARIATGDLDGDGLEDLVVSDLGNPMPTDEPVGRVVVGRNAGDGSFEWQVIADGIGRVSDARPIDLDADGDLDVAVAAFGWLRSGGVYVLRNETLAPGPLDFRVEQVSARPGAVSVVPVHDLGPGHGFAVAFSQHHELVSVFHATGEGFEERILYRAPHPNWGTSNLEAVDLDGDGDTDFLLAHGDTLDDGIPFKPYHGVEWLENRGGKFHPHRIGALYGAHAAVAADLDGDGDQDVLASGFLPQVQLPVPKGGMRVDSVIWFERRADAWIPWSVGIDLPRHTGMTVVDLNDDGRLDVVAGINTAWDVNAREEGPALAMGFNEGPREPVSPELRGRFDPARPEGE
jgi:hypothetical protein